MSSKINNNSKILIFLSFIGMSLSWSFSWFAMKIQTESLVPTEVSVFYRFAFSSALMFILCFITKQRMKISKNELLFLVIIGICNFSLNFIIGYHAVDFIASGIMAVIFSLSIITSEIISCIIDKRSLEKRILFCSLIGFIGLGFFIFPTIHFDHNNNSSKALIGFALSISMMIIYSIGNVFVAKNRKKNQTPLYTLIAYGSLFGSISNLLINFIKGNEFSFDFSINYTLSISYLVIIATIVAFICLFNLIQTIGSARANYTALVYPILALSVSCKFENVNFNYWNAIGLIMILLALIIEFIPQNFSLKRKSK